MWSMWTTQLWGPLPDDEDDCEAFLSASPPAADLLPAALASASLCRSPEPRSRRGPPGAQLRRPRAGLHPRRPRLRVGRQLLSASFPASLAKEAAQGALTFSKHPNRLGYSAGSKTTWALSSLSSSSSGKIGRDTTRAPFGPKWSPSSSAHRPLQSLHLHLLPFPALRLHPDLDLASPPTSQLSGERIPGSSALETSTFSFFDKVLLSSSQLSYADQAGDGDGGIGDPSERALVEALASSPVQAMTRAVRHFNCRERHDTSSFPGRGCSPGKDAVGLGREVRGGWAGRRRSTP